MTESRKKLNSAVESLTEEIDNAILAGEIPVTEFVNTANALYILDSVMRAEAGREALERLYSKMQPVDAISVLKTSKKGEA